MAGTAERYRDPRRCNAAQHLLSKGLWPQVETILARPEGLHEGFRLWITAEPHPAFPIGLLHIGLKLTNEAPVGVKAGLRASFQWLSQVCCFVVSLAAEALGGGFTR